MSYILQYSSFITRKLNQFHSTISTPIKKTVMPIHITLNVKSIYISINNQFLISNSSFPPRTPFFHLTNLNISLPTLQFIYQMSNINVLYVRLYNKNRHIRNVHLRMNGQIFYHIRSSHRMAIVFYCWLAYKKLAPNISLISNTLR